MKKNLLTLKTQFETYKQSKQTSCVIRDIHAFTRT